MKELGLEDIPLSKIDIGDRLRPVDEAHAAFLAENIRQNERLRQPIELRKTGDRYSLIAGRHRLRAVEMLGWPSIRAFIYSANDDEARLAEIDENLVRYELNPLDRAVFLAERKEIYERLHPTTVAGVAGAASRHHATEIISFARETAERIGLTERTVQMAVSIARSILPTVRARIAGSRLAQNQSELMALSRVPPEQQMEIVEAVLAGEYRSVSAARAVLDGRNVKISEDQASLNKLLTAWRHASPSVRASFLAFIQKAEKEAA